MSPDPCSDFSSSSFDPSDHSPPPIAPNPLAAAPDPVSQRPPYAPSCLPPSQAQASTTTPSPTPLPLPEISSETSAPRSTAGSQGFTLTSLDPLPYPVLNKQETLQQDPSPYPAPLLPVWEAAGAEGIVGVHVPFSLTDLAQIEESLGSFSSDPDNYLKVFKYLTQSYDLAWHDIYIILSPTLLPEEKGGIWQASQAHADETHRTDDTEPIGASPPRR